MSATAVAERLGGKRVLGRRITSELELADAVRSGLPSSALDHVLAELTGTVATQAEVYAVVGSARTLQRKRSARLALSVDESDRLARLARMLVRAEEALGDAAKARRWLVSPNRALESERPLTLLDSDAGALAVERVLGRIEHGVYG
ncbi:MAG TPA: antitoxin Xre/MbcA/ParS toxin-binding domain-containing protein [Gemmatimonadales bacterium]